MFEVLLVDDSAAVRMDLRNMEIWGDVSNFQISAEAGNGAEAIQCLQERAFDLVITDIRMPCIDGIELLKSIKENWPETYVVLLSDFGEFEYARNAILYGAFDYLVKPMQENDLKNLLERLNNDLEKQKNQFTDSDIMSLENTYDMKKMHDTLDLAGFIACILNVDHKAMGMATMLPRTLGVLIGDNPTHIAYLMNNILDEIVRSVEQKYPWVKKYSILREIKHIDYFNIKDIGMIEKHMSDCINRLIDYLGCFLLGKDEESIERRICLLVLESDFSEMHLKPIAEKMFISTSHLSEVFSQKTGIAFKDYLLMVRMGHAKYLATESTLRNSEMAELLGYKDTEYFCRLFHEYSGFTIAEYRKLHIGSIYS